MPPAAASRWGCRIAALLFACAVLLAGCGQTNTELLDRSPQFARFRERSMLWLHAGQGLAVEEGRVVAWNDRSPVEREVFATEPEEAPTRGAWPDQGGVSFEAGDQLRLEGPFDGFEEGFTLVMTARLDSVSVQNGAEFIKLGESVSQYSLGLDDAGRLVFQMEGRGTAFGPEQLTEAPILVVGRLRSDSKQTLRINGKPVREQNSLAPVDRQGERKSLYIGKQAVWTLAHLSVYPVALSDEDIEELELALSTQFRCCSSDFAVE